LYPEVFDGYIKYTKEFGDLSRMGSDVYFHGLSEGETCEVEIADGKTYMIKLLKIGKLDMEGNKAVAFEVNGNRTEIKTKDRNNKDMQEFSAIQMADESNHLEHGAPIPGTVSAILVSEGDTITENQPLMIVEAMKMETKVSASVAGVVESIVVKEGQQVKAGELLISLK
jgi:pyruvate carboxylase